MMWPVSWKTAFPVHIVLLGILDVQSGVPAHTSALAEISGQVPQFMQPAF